MEVVSTSRFSRGSEMHGKTSPGLGGTSGFGGPCTYPESSLAHPGAAGSSHDGPRGFPMSVLEVRGAGFVVRLVRGNFVCILVFSVMAYSLS